MNQLTLFDVPARISRRSDPITSQKSAAETERRINTFQWLALQAIKNASKPITANEAAREAAKHYVANIETFRKRVMRHPLVFPWNRWVRGPRQGSRRLWVCPVHRHLHP